MEKAKSMLAVAVSLTGICLSWWFVFSVLF